MPELITIEEAARITGFPSEDIQYWAKSHKITSYSVTRDSRLVDLANLREFISHIEHLGIQKLYLQQIFYGFYFQLREALADIGRQGEVSDGLAYPFGGTLGYGDE